MELYLDKIILLISCCFYLLGRTITIRHVSAVLLTLIISCLILYRSKRRLVLGLGIAYLGCCLMIPELCYFIPLLCYDFFEERLWPLMGAAVLIALGYHSLFSLNGSFLLLFLCAIACLVSWRTRELLKLQNAYRELRDQSTELNLLLEQKNQTLIEQQDNEIHLATLRERNRIAREIHDNVGHMLSRSLLQTGALQMLNKDKNLTENLDLLKETLSEAMDNIRQSVHGLHEESIDLYQSVRQILAAYPHYNIHLDYDISEEVPKTIKYCFLSTIKEALTNVSKHSNATTITVILREHPALYQLLIEDNGRTDKALLYLPENGLGLDSMKERVQALNGSIRFTSDHGFKIFISIPKNRERM